MKTISELIEAFCDLYNYDGYVNLTCRPYVKFKNDITDFIYENSLQNSLEWSNIKENLVTSSNEYMDGCEADCILANLEKIKTHLLERKCYSIDLLRTAESHLKLPEENINNNYGQKYKNHNKVFIVHGHDDFLLTETKNLMLLLGIEAIVLKEEPNGGVRTILEKFENFSDVEFAIVLFTPDDLGCKKNERNNLKLRARQNVILELGFFAGKLGRENVIIINGGVEELPSDINGAAYTPNSLDWKYKVTDELRTAGFSVSKDDVK